MAILSNYSKENVLELLLSFTKFIIISELLTELTVLKVNKSSDFFPKIYASLKTFIFMFILNQIYA